MALNDTPFTPGWKEVMRQSRNEAGRLGHDYIGPEHFLLGIIRKGEGLAVQTLLNMEVDLDDLKLELERMLEVGKGPTVGIFPQNVEAKKVIETARQIAKQLKHNWIGTEHLLLALIKEENTLAARVLKQFSVDFNRTKREVLQLIEGSNASSSGKTAAPRGDNGEKSKTPALDTFGRDLTQLAREGKLDPVIGREDEVERILQILCRRTKNNPILLGEPGVGKTAIVEGLAQRIVSEDIPEILKDKRLLSLDLAAIVAGTKYRGQFEERLKAIMQEIRRSKDVLIFIDELHTLVGAGAAEGAIDASNMLKPALSRGEIQCIGATTLEEFRKYIEKDGALERRFQSIIINQPTRDQAYQILKGLRPRYESHHNVIISDEALESAVNLSDRYVTDRFLPDKAIDVIDEAGSRARLLANVKPQDIKDLEKSIVEKEEELRQLTHQQEFEKCKIAKEERDGLIEKRERMMEAWNESKNKETMKTLGNDEMAYIVSKWTGIPIVRMEEEETRKLMRMEADLGERVISQKEALAGICKAIRRSRSGLKDPARPTGCFLFLGPTGVGKTELAKALAEFLFGEQDALIRIDMSEYMEKYSVSRLMGAPPGYVGYEEGGQLTEKVRQRPYSVVLLDEIEKAHPDVFSLLLQVFDDGRLTDSWGHVVNFRNTVIILTSNVGTKRMKQSRAMGFGESGVESDYAGMKDKVMQDVKKVFNPEFLNRLDEITVFHPLSQEDIFRILDILMGRLNKRLLEKNIILTLSPAVKEKLAEEGYDPEYGARPLRRVIQRRVEDPLSYSLISGEIPQNCEIAAELKDGEVTFTVVKTKEEEKQEPALSGAT